LTSVPVLRTDRLLLRGFTPDDRAPFAALNADPRVMEHLPAPLSRQQSDAFVERIEAGWRSRGLGLWAVERLDDGVFVGYVGLWPVRLDLPVRGSVEVGWRLAASQWGQGLATEGARQALRFGFDVRGLDEVVSFTSVVNLRSQRVMQRLGMTRDASGDFDHPALPVGHRLRPHVLYRASA